MRLVALDWVNFLLADVRGGLGAYVIVYLVTRAHWSQATVGAVLTVSGLTGIMLHPSVGALIDNIRAKRALLIVATLVLSVCGLAVVWAPTLPVVLAADIAMAVLGGVFAPVVAAMTVGLCDSDALPARLGRNAVFEPLGRCCRFRLGRSIMTGPAVSPRRMSEPPASQRAGARCCARGRSSCSRPRRPFSVSR